MNTPVFKYMADAVNPGIVTHFQIFYNKIFSISESNYRKWGLGKWGRRFAGGAAGAKGGRGGVLLNVIFE
jgi:hypothetical protein